MTYTGNQEYEILVEKLNKQGLDVKKVEDKLKQQQIETPSWGYGDSGTRFGVFRQAGAARDLYEKIDDAAQVHKYTGITPTVAIHIPWDKVDDFEALKQYAAERGMQIGAVNPNVFQDQQYKLGSIANHNPKIRKMAVDHILECIEIMKKTGSKNLSLWFADGTNYPGQADFRKRKAWVEETLAAVYQALPDDARMLIEYKLFEPGFYHTDLCDWGTAYAVTQKLGPKAQVLIDLGHHALGTNIEFIVAYLIADGKMGGFHFNNKKYADDDLTVGSINPYEVFLIYNEIVSAEEDPSITNLDIAYMIDQSHNLKPKIEAMIQSVVNLQEAYAKANLVNRPKLAEAQNKGDIVSAEEILLQAYRTDVKPILAKVREEMGASVEPLEAFRASGYQEEIAKKRAVDGRGSQGWA